MIDGIPVCSENTGTASPTSTTSASSAYGNGRRQSRSPQAANRAERCSLECAHLSASLSTFELSLASTAGSNVIVAASTKTTDSMMPRLIDLNAGLGTSMTALSETSTVAPENRTALPRPSSSPRPPQLTAPSRSTRRETA